MKNLKIIFILAFLLLFSHAGMIISPQSLPQNAQDFIKTYFNAQIGIAEMDGNSYEVYLSDGSEIEFYLDGTWEEVENKVNFINIKILPENIANIITHEFVGAKIVEIERKINYYKIKLNTGIKLKIDFNAMIIDSEMDD